MTTDTEMSLWFELRQPRLGRAATETRWNVTPKPWRKT